jgi:hypothetical protein
MRMRELFEEFFGSTLKSCRTGTVAKMGRDRIGTVAGMGRVAELGELPQRGRQQSGWNGTSCWNATRHEKGPVKVTGPH